jgi:hypothetical protein
MAEAEGELVPIPTLPVDVIRTRSVPVIEPEAVVLRVIKPGEEDEEIAPSERI